MYSHIKSLLFNRPLLVAQSRLDVILDGLIPRLFDGVQAQHELQDRPDAVLETERSAAIIPVHGTLTNRRMGMDARSERLMSYLEIGDMLEMALEDPRIDHIVLDIDSPGGEAAGVMDLSDRIFEARDIKPVTAIIDERGLSAAYAIASGASRVIMSRTASAGSIGVVAAHIDQSKADAEEGLKYTLVFAGEHKVDFTSHKPLSADARTTLQGEVDELYDLFVSTVARNRSLSEQHVRDTQGKVFTGQAAFDAGLVDSIEPARKALDSVIQSVEEVPIMATATNTKGPETATKPAAQSVEPTINVSDAQAIIAACNEAGLAVIAGQCIAHSMTLDQVKTRIEQAQSIKAACAIAGLSGQADAMLASSASVDQVKAKLFDQITTEGSAFRQAETVASKAKFLEGLVDQDEAKHTQTGILPDAGLAPGADSVKIQSSWDDAYQSAGVQ